MTRVEPKVVLLFPPQTILQHEPFMGNNDVAQLNTASPLFQVLTIPGITAVLVGHLVSEPAAPRLLSPCVTQWELTHLVFRSPRSDVAASKYLFSLEFRY